jgi:aflatoxin B1 aldehyde reductase
MIPFEFTSEPASLSINKPYPKITYGTAVPFATREDAVRAFELAASRGVESIDTARQYPNSEDTIGSLRFSTRFKITTKAPGFTPGDGTKAKVIEYVEESLRVLGVQKVDVYLLHAPDVTTPFEETMEAIQELYQQGRFDKVRVSYPALIPISSQD